MLAYTDLTELFNYRHPPILPLSPAHLRIKLTRPLPIKDGGVLRAVEDVRAYMTAVLKHRETSAQWQRCGPHCETAPRAHVSLMSHLALSIQLGGGGGATPT
jgi:hypothetical protein